MALSNVSPSCYETSFVVLHFRLRLHRPIQNAQQLVACETCRVSCMKTISDRAAKLRLAPNRSEPASIWPPCEDPLHLNSTRNFRQTADQHDILVSKRKILTTYWKSFACPNNTYSKDRRLTPSLLLSKVTGSRYCDFQHTSVEVVQRYPTGNHYPQMNQLSKWHG
jgi:hypothetical protein